MIKKSITKDALSLTLTPNKSSTVQQNLIFFGFLSVICMTFAIGFFVLGATMILPFAGLEILILFLVLKANRNWLNQSEKIELDKLKDLNLKLTTQYHLENSPAIIEKIAKENLGMAKKRPKKIKYE